MSNFALNAIVVSSAYVFLIAAVVAAFVIPSRLDDRERKQLERSAQKALSPDKTN